MIIRVAGIDPSYHTGLAVIEVKGAGHGLTLHDYNVVDSPPPTPTEKATFSRSQLTVRRVMALSEPSRAFLAKARPTRVGVEIARGRQHLDVARMFGQMDGLFTEMAIGLGLKLFAVDPEEVKESLRYLGAGPHTAPYLPRVQESKEATVAWALTHFPLLITNLPAVYRLEAVCDAIAIAAYTATLPDDLCLNPAPLP